MSICFNTFFPEDPTVDSRVASGTWRASRDGRPSRQPALDGNSPVFPDHVRFRHVQMVDCQAGLASFAASGPQACFYAGNLLMTNLLTGFSGTYYSGIAEHLTADHVGVLISASGYQGTVCVTNGILANVANVTANLGNVCGAYNGFYASPTFGSQVMTTTNYPFQSVGAGGYYLAVNSPFRNVGSIAINADLATALRKKTTYPPIVLTDYCMTDLVLSPQAQRDADGMYDLGWHSDPLDYCMSEFILPSGTLVLTNGVAVGVFGPYGARLNAV